MTTLPEEAVKAAAVAISNELARGLGVKATPLLLADMALTAALPFLPVQGAVKKLEWNEYEREGQIEEWDASSGFDGYYNITLGLNGYLVKMPDDEEESETLEAAKAAAQADYEARILSTLEPSAARELALEEAARVCDAKIVSMQAHYDQTDNPFIRSNLAGDIALISHLAAAIRALSSPDHNADAGKVEGDGWSMSPPKFHRYPYFVENISGKWCLCKHHGNVASHTISVHETAREARDAAPSEGA